MAPRSSTDNPPATRRRLIVRGQVQGVGFRPFVYRLAGELAVGGFVRNDGAGATIELQGEPARLDQFVSRLRSELPSAARIDRLEQQVIQPLPDQDDFRICLSDRGPAAEADVTPDIATCPDCLNELFDPANRRFGYQFINCTNCGPRYSIVRDVPYDRPMTTMAPFRMCSRCQAEYDDPADRRFHAQPNACPACGPTVWLMTPEGKRVRTGGTAGAVVAAAAAALLDGKIVAIRGVGGFHLAVRADRDEPVLRLRQRKGREHKPLALMVKDLAAAEALAELSESARGVLVSPQRPIVIAPRRPDAPVSRHVAPGTDTLGIMLPYAPLHHLLFAELEGSAPSGESASLPLRPGVIPLVMTSGNMSNEPIAADNDEAVTALGAVADLFLVHDRDIARRIDDSVVAAAGRMAIPLRRARGCVPVGIDLPRQIGAVGHGLAVGGELKSTVAVVRNRGQVAQAVMSEHIGELNDARTYRHFERVIERLVQVTYAQPAWIAHDLHPMYLSSTWAGRQGLPLVGVQHHHAHIAACLAEHGLTGPVIGLAADGVGYGDDGTMWGGEVLVADIAGYVRVGRFRPLRLPGGDAAAVRTARPAVAWLFDAADGHVPDGWLARMLPDRLERDIVLRQLLEGVNCPASSGLGRYFDAAAAMLGLADFNHFEAQAPMALEAAIEHGCDEVLPFALAECDEPERNAERGMRNEGPTAGSASLQSEIRGPRFEIDLRPTVTALVEQIEANRSVGQLAGAFHNTVAAALAAAADRAVDLTGLRTVALSGGVFCNRYLSLRLAGLLAGERGLTVLAHREVPPNDGGLALGQAVVGAARMSGFRSKLSLSGLTYVPGDARTDC